MTPYLPLQQRPRRRTLTLWLLPIALSLLAALLATDLQLPSSVEVPAALPVSAVAVARTPAPRLDHSVLSDTARLPEPEPWPLSVAAYGD